MPRSKTMKLIQMAKTPNGCLRWPMARRTMAELDALFSGECGADLARPLAQLPGDWVSALRQAHRRVGLAFASGVSGGRDGRLA